MKCGCKKLRRSTWSATYLLKCCYVFKSNALINFCLQGYPGKYNIGSIWDVVIALCSSVLSCVAVPVGTFSVLGKAFAVSFSQWSFTIIASY